MASRLFDYEGTNDFEAHLRGLATTDFVKDALGAILAASPQEERDWAIGEAIAEAWLGKENNVVWPWNLARDKRTPKASLPGADLVGFLVDESNTRLVLGEVKSSREEQSPPQVMSGRSGMEHQIDRLATDLSLIITLLKWLWPRCKNTAFQTHYDASVRTFLKSGNTAVSLFGVLVRDTAVNEQDLRARGLTLGSTIEHPTFCSLIALYIPCRISDLPVKVKGASES